MLNERDGRPFTATTLTFVEPARIPKRMHTPVEDGGYPLLGDGPLPSHLGRDHRHSRCNFSMSFLLAAGKG